MNTCIVRAAVPSDLPAIEAIERRCFHASRRSSRRSLARSLRSSSQSVWVAVCRSNSPRQVVGAMVLRHYRLSLRIYSLGVLPAFRGSGVGRMLVQQAVRMARKGGRQVVSLEADRRNKVLTGWYETFGFETVCILKDYYSPGRHAVRMRFVLNSHIKGTRKDGCSQSDCT